MSDLPAIKERNICVKCLRSDKTCLCEYVVKIDTKIHFVILIHPKEFREKTGTGRLTHLSLKNSEMIMGVDFSKDNRVNELINTRDCYLLYPGDDAIKIDEEKVLLNQKKETVFFIIDGTWATAKKMMKLSLNLHLLKRVSFNVNFSSEFKIKQQPDKFCLSTIESTALLLSHLQSSGVEHFTNNPFEIVDVFKKMVEFQIKCASDTTLTGYRHKSYKLPSLRKPKKITRKVFY